MTGVVEFLANNPTILVFDSFCGILLEKVSAYLAADGRLFALPYDASLQLCALNVRHGEEISICRYEPGSNWVICLTPRSEKARADAEIAAQELRARQLAQETREDPGRQLAASLASLRQMPKSADSAAQERPEVGRGTGTTGPAPAIAPAPRKSKGEVIPFNLAFREVVAFVCAELNASGEQWSEQSRQDLVATVLIAGSKAGYVGVWERGER